MQVRFCPSDYEPSGVVSFASWSNPDLLEGIRRAFHEAPRERITEIVIERDGIKAVFELKNSR